MIDRSRSPILHIFSGLPGSGKSSIAKLLAARIGAAYLRIDTIEQALRELCAIEVEGEGYRFAYRLASDQLGLGVSVVADSCNPIELTRREWEGVALTAQARYVNIEVVCSDPAEHRRRVEQRGPPISGLRLPTWEEVENREYAPWTKERIVVDTAGRSAAEAFDELVTRLAPGRE